MEQFRTPCRPSGLALFLLFLWAGSVNLCRRSVSQPTGGEAPCDFPSAVESAPRWPSEGSSLEENLQQKQQRELLSDLTLMRQLLLQTEEQFLRIRHGRSKAPQIQSRRLNSVPPFDWSTFQLLSPQPPRREGPWMSSPQSFAFAPAPNLHSAGRLSTGPTLIVPETPVSPFYPISTTQRQATGFPVPFFEEESLRPPRLPPEPASPGLEVEAGALLDALQKLSESAATQIGFEKKAKPAVRTLEEGVPSALYAHPATAGVGRAVELGGAIVDVLLRTPSFLEAINDLADVFLPLPGATARRREAALRNGISRSRVGVPSSTEQQSQTVSVADWHSSTASAITVLEFFSAIERTLTSASSFKESLVQALGLPPSKGKTRTRKLHASSVGGFHLPRLFNESSASRPIEDRVLTLEEAAAKSVLDSLSVFKGENDDGSAPTQKRVHFSERTDDDKDGAEAAEASTDFPDVSGLNAASGVELLDLGGWVEALQSTVELLQASFEASRAFVEFAEKALSKMQVHHLLEQQRQLLHKGRLAEWGIVSDLPPPEEFGEPRVVCTTQGLTCCVPFAAATGFQQRPIYLQSKATPECKAYFNPRTSDLCASAAFDEEPSACGLLKETLMRGTDEEKVKFTAALPLPNFAAAAVCSCSSRKKEGQEKNQENKEAFEGSASWDREGGAKAVDIAAAAGDGFAYAKSFVQTGEALSLLLRRLTDPKASILDRAAQVLRLLSLVPPSPPPPPFAFGEENSP